MIRTVPRRMQAVLVSPPYWDLFQEHLSTPGAFEPLGLEYVCSSARDAGFVCEVLFPEVVSAHAVASQVAGAGYNLVGIGATTPAIPWCLGLARALKEIDPDITVVLGGDHPSADAKIVRDPSVDYAIAGEGEHAFVQLLRALEGEEEFSAVPGLRWSVPGGGIAANAPGQIRDVSGLPRPTRSPQILRRCRLRGLAYPAPSSQHAAAQVLFSRGCSRQCSFCASRNVLGAGIRCRPAMDVVAEIQQLRDEFGVDLVYFSDLSFGQARGVGEKLLQLMAEARLGVPWYASAACQDVSDGMAEQMAQAGCFKLAVGIESMHPATHRTLRPWSRVEDVEESVARIDAAGLLVRGYYLIGVPGETLEQFRDGIEHLCRLPVDELRLAFLTPFPGTPIYEQCKGMTITSDYSHYTSAEPILDLPGFPPEQQRAARDWALRRFYGGPEYSARWREKLRRFPRFEQSFAEFFDFLKTWGIEMH